MPVPAGPDLTEVATAVFEEPSLTELDPLTAVDLPTALPAAPALPAVPAQTTAAEPVTVGAVAAPPPEPAVETPAGVLPTAPTPDAPPSPEVTQTAPTNVNVSVRVNSPGDNGSVEQVNNAASITETAPQYQPDAPQYQEPIPAADAPTAESAPQPASSGPASSAEGWGWNWEWNCGDAIPEVAVPTDAGMQNWTWNWNWNCEDPDSISTNTVGEKPPQYQPGVTQYRPININISIRINSPGNDGPVKQTNNIAVVVLAPALPPVRVELPVMPAAQPGSASVGFQALVSPAPPIAFITQMFTEPEQPFAQDGCCALPELAGVSTEAAEPQSVLVPQAPPANRRDRSARERFRASIAVTIRLAKASEAAARVARPAPKPAQLRPAPRSPAAPTREQASAPSAAGFAPVNAADGRLGYFVLLVVGLAFAFAFAEASRSVAADVRAAGEDPDPPPDRPG